MASLKLPVNRRRFFKQPPLARVRVRGGCLCFPGAEHMIILNFTHPLAPNRWPESRR